MPEIFYVGDTVTVMLAAYLGDDSAVDGILADVRFDARQLTLQSVSPLNCTLESDLSLAAEGRGSAAVAQQDGRRHRVRGAYLQARRRFGGGRAGRTGADRRLGGLRRRLPPFARARILARGAQAHGDESFALRFPNAQVDFDPAVLSYDVLLPEDQPQLEIEADYAQGESVYIGETTVEPGLRRTISVIYTDKNGNMTVYTFRVWRRTAAQTDSSLAGIWLHGLPLKGFDKRTTAYALTVGARLNRSA